MKWKAFISGIGVVGAYISHLFGGWTASLTTLCIFMGIDLITGLIVAGVFHKSTKTETGALQSKIGWQGLCRKGMTLLLILVAHRIDIALGTVYVKDGVCIAFIVNEGVSIIENGGLMGIPIPKILTDAIDVLKNGKGGNDDE